MEKVSSFEQIVYLVAVTWFGQALGPALGTMVLIVLGWLGGVIIGLFRIEDSDRIGTLGFIVVTFIGTLGTAGTAATFLATTTAKIGVGMSPADLLFFVALAIPMIGKDWLALYRWGLARVRRLILGSGGPSRE